jgi:PAS domain S-box-containing protein
MTHSPLQEIIALLRSDGTFSYCSPSFAAFVGWDADSLRTKTLDSLMHPDDVARIHDEMAHQKALGETVFDLEFRLVRRDGSSVWVDALIAPLEDPAQDDVRLLAIGRLIQRRHELDVSLIESRKPFESAFEYSPIGMALVSPEGQWLRSNRSVTRFLGYSAQELRGMTFQQITHPEDLDKDVHLLQKVLAGEIDTYTMEKRYFHKDGSIVWALLGATMIRDMEGKPLYFISQIEDITERKRIELELRMTSQRLQMALEGAQIGTWDWDIVTGEVVTDENWAKIIGYGLNEVDPNFEPWLSMIHPDDRDAVLQRLDDHLKGKTRTYVSEHRLRAKDGSWVWVLDRGRISERDAEGNPRRAVGIHMNITERKLVEQQAIELALERERVELLTKFIQIASHEFKTPLSIILSSLYLMNRTDNPATRSEKSLQIEAQVSRINQLLGMLEIQTRLDSQVSFKYLLISLTHLIHTRARKYQLDAASRGVALDFDLKPDMSPASIDESFLALAIDQLLDNALNHTTPGGSILFRTGEDDKDVWVEVIDSGTGIPAEAIPLVTQRFFRLDAAHSTPGFGLGLSIVDEIVRRHCGQLEIESALGAGSTFRIRLPRTANPVPEADPTHEHSA